MRIGSALNNSNYYVDRMNNSRTKNDPVAEGITNRIRRLQEQLKSISKDDKMPMEEKREKRKELQQEMIELNKQLMQRQLEKQKEEREQKVKQMQEKARKLDDGDGEENGISISTSDIQMFISSDTSMSEIKTIDKVKTKIEGEKGVLEMEIKLDKGRGVDTTKKEEQLAGIKASINSLVSNMGDRLKNINKKINKSNENSPNIEDDKNNHIKDEKNKENEDQMYADNRKINEDSINHTENSEIRNTKHTPIDVRL